MVYKRYIKRDGKTFGPYYYESYRDETGKTRTKFVNSPNKKFSIKLIYLLIIFSLFLTAGFFILNKNSNETSKISSLSIKENPPQISLGNFIKLIGFQVSEGDDSAVPSPRDDAVAPSEDETSAESGEAPITEKIAEDSPRDDSAEPNIEEQQEIIEEEPVQNEIIENISEISPEINQTEENLTSKNETIIETTQTITEDFTISETNQTILAENFTLSEEIVQYSAKLGEPVKWKKTLKLDTGENEIVNNLEVTLPKTAGDVSVKKTNSDGTIEELNVNVKNEKIVEETEPIISITGEFVKNEEKNNFLNKIFKFFKGFFSLVGRVIDVNENEDEVLVNIQEELEDQEEIEIEYFTEAPYSEEIIFNENYKKINIVGSEEIHYENVLAFSNLSKEVSKNEINLYWIKNDTLKGTSSKELIDFESFDKNNNNLIDYIEWNVPSLSNQTYELILISKAQHLDSNKNFISDIYDEVKELDEIWSEQINDSEYVRVTFEKNLTNENDITIYPRIVSGNPKIEIYEFNKTELIAEFTNILDNEYNKVYLTNLVGEQDTFDLKILGGSVELDYIVDPFTGPSSGVWMDLSGNDTGNWAGTDSFLSVAVNTNNNLIYTALGSGKFGVYNHSNGVWMDLSGNDTGNWVNTDIVWSVSVNPNDNLVYTALTSGKFGVYNHSNGVWMDLSGNDTGNWASINDFRGVEVNPNNNLVYTTSDNGKFGVYNHSNGVWMDLSGNDTGNWVGTTIVYGATININDNLVYTGLGSGKFGVYNHSNGVWMDLSGNDTGNWVGTVGTIDSAIDINNNLIYTAVEEGKFGVYNHSNGIWMNLSGNDTGDWAGIDVVYSVTVNTNDNLVYTGLDLGKFGVYNQANGVWMNLSANDTGNWAGTDSVYGVAVNPNDNLVYTALANGKFGVYRKDLFSGAGAGVLASPYEITDCMQLQEMKNNTAGHYELLNNIDCSDTINWNNGAGFSPVGTNINTVVFAGSLQGNNYNITNLYIKNSTTTYVGLFGYAVNATINKVHLWNAYIEGSTTEATGNVGGLVGALDDNSTIANSSVHGNITSKGTIGYTGGLAGWINSYSSKPKIFNSSFTGNISASGNNGIGGIVGWSDGIVNYSFSNVKLNASAGGVGGLVGFNAVDGSEAGIIDHSYSLGNVSVVGTSGIVGGLVGRNSGNILQSYSAMNVSANRIVGGLAGRNAANISHSYSCGGEINTEVTSGGGLIGDTLSSIANASFSYSANVLSGGGVLVGGFVGRDPGSGSAKFNASFYDYELDIGNYNDTGNIGNHSGIFGNTTAQMKKSSTYAALGWDFTNVWRIDEDYSYPYFKWQTAPICGTTIPPITPPNGGSGGNNPETELLFSSFNVAPTTMKIILNQSETKTECFTVASTGTLSVNVNLKAVGEIINFTNLTNSVLQIPVQNSKSACAIFSAGQNNSGNYTGKIEIDGGQKKYINVALEIREIKKGTFGILPLDILFAPSMSWGILPLGIIFSPSMPIGILPLGEFIPGPIGILPIQEDLPFISPALFETLVKGVVFLSLWIILLLLLIIYLAIRRFIKLQDQLSGYKSREEKLAVIENLKRNSLRKETNFFERMVDKGAIYLSEKKLEVKQPVKAVSENFREVYNKGAGFYSKGKYDDALKEFKKSVEINKNFWQGYQGIGNCYFAKGDKEIAKRAFEKSLEINPENKELVEFMRRKFFGG